ncbi:MAG TPA: EamA family transporter, partial [Gemmatimonadales bacterium]|nr:EamA family transporter [Gemmatimonadales bacterium]
GARQEVKTAGIGAALIAGVAIGIFLIALAQTNRNAGLWPLLTDRIASVAFFAIVLSVARARLALPARITWLALGGGALDMTANALYLLAVWIGPFSAVVTLASLYPASTVLLARALLGERLSAWQTAGVITALVAVVLIVGG